MSQPSDIPVFRGDESPEEAEMWLKTFVDGTGSFSDSGIFRLLFSKFPDGSPAQEWFENLSDASTASWKVFRHQFYARWITITKQWREELAWDAFRHHVLTEEAIFDGETMDAESAHDVIATWVDNHLRLAKATDGKDKGMIDMTRNLLPAFVRAYLRVYIAPPHANFDDICSNIKGIPLQLLDFECSRRQMSPTAYNLSMERRIEEISGKLDRLVKALGQDGMRISGATVPSGSPNEGVRSDRNNESSDAVVVWEPYSPLTSVMSVSLTTSELSTPVAQSTSLPNPSEDSIVGDRTMEVPDGLYSKPITLKARDELISIAERVIDFIANHGQPLRAPLACQSSSIKSALALYDKLTDCGVYRTKGLLYSSDSDASYDSLMGEIANIHSYCAYQKIGDISSGMAKWANLTGNAGIFLRHSQRSVSDYRGYTYIHNLCLSPSGEPQTAGGVIDPNTNWDIVNISSVWTVLFMALSSYLAECTGEEKYTKTAILSANCIRTWMLEPATSLVKDCSVNAVTAKENDGASLSCHLTGIAIEGLSVLASVTRDDEWKSLAIQIATSAMKHRDWHNSEGVLIVGADGEQSQNTNTKAFKGLLNRGLMVAYQYNRTNEPFCKLVRSYINIQFDTLFNCSRLRSSYGIDWRGPYKGPYIHGQLAAVDTIVAAIGVNDS